MTATPTLRERLAQKRRRRVVQPVQIAPPSEREQVVVADLSLAVVEGREVDATELEQLRAERYVDVAFSALDPDVWEKIAATHPSPTGADGGLDWRAALPIVAALCCEDPSMQDDAAWRETLYGITDDGVDGDTGWSYGELLGLWGALLSINAEHPSAHVPKG
jgi:hypothetical protein